MRGRLTTLPKNVDGIHQTLPLTIQRSPWFFNVILLFRYSPPLELRCTRE